MKAASNTSSKVELSDLALLGGSKLFERAHHVGRPNIGSRDAIFSRLNDILDRRWLTNNGPLVRDFEDEIARRLGVEHCVAICNGTVALEIAVRALSMHGEVITPSFTFVATAHCLQWQEIRPIFCDIDDQSKTIDTSKIEALITERTTGIIGVHLWGRPCDVSRLQEIADYHDLKLLYDSSHAMGVSVNQRMIGGFGNAEVLSFHGTKFINSFEGGAIVTNDPDLDQRVRYMKNFGFSGLDQVSYLGINGKMSEVCAAMGLTSLESIDDFVDWNFRNYRAYSLGLEGIPGCTLLKFNENEKNNFQYIVLEIERDDFGMDRDLLVDILTQENVLARRYFYPGVHNMEPYRTLYPDQKRNLPITEQTAQKTLCLPTGTAISPDEIGPICELIRFTQENSSMISSRINSS